MATDNDKLNFLSTWDIDQLVATAEVAVPSGTTALYTIPSTLPAIPVFEVQIKVGTKWYQTGTFATSNTLATSKIMNAYVSSGQLFISTNTAGTARYFVWQDKVNY
jgi:hypothetical protein